MHLLCLRSTPNRWQILFLSPTLPVQMDLGETYKTKVNRNKTPKSNQRIELHIFYSRPPLHLPKSAAPPTFGSLCRAQSSKILFLRLRIPKWTDLSFLPPWFPAVYLARSYLVCRIGSLLNLSCKTYTTWRDVCGIENRSVLLLVNGRLREGQ